MYSVFTENLSHNLLTYFCNLLIHNNGHFHLLMYSKVEMTGNEMTEYLHPLDHDELKQILTVHPSEIAANSGQSGKCAVLRCLLQI